MQGRDRYDAGTGIAHFVAIADQPRHLDISEATVVNIGLYDHLRGEARTRIIAVTEDYIAAKHSHHRLVHQAALVVRTFVLGQDQHLAFFGLAVVGHIIR